MGIQDPLLNSLILQLNELIAEKSGRHQSGQSSQHPTIVRLNAQTESVKRSLRENVENIISQSDMALDNLNKRIRGFEAQVRATSATERNFVNIERKYKLNNETYTFLLQKLSEAQIAKASNVSDSQVIEEAQLLERDLWNLKDDNLCCCPAHWILLSCWNYIFERLFQHESQFAGRY